MIKSSIIARNKIMPKKKIKLSKLRDYTLKTNDRHHVPLPTGKYQKIGCRDLMIGLSRKSGILTRLYYPAKTDPGKQYEMNPFLWPNWLPHEFYTQGYADVANIRSKFMFSMANKTRKKNVFIPAVPNARPHQLPVGQKYPIVIFSHGLGSCRTTYSAICCELASQGFVVAALEHRDNSACLTFYPKRPTYSFKNSNPDFFNQIGDQVDADDEVDFGDEIDDPNYIPPKALTALTHIPHLELAWIRFRYVSVFRADDDVLAFRKKQIQQRVRECTRALDLMEALNAGYEIDNLLDPGYNYREFENMLDMDRVSLMGHSFGGATVLMAGSSELRFKTIIALDPWMFPIKDETLDLIPQPVSMIFSENLSKIPNTKSIDEWLRSDVNNDYGDDRNAIIINGSNHLQQSDIPYVFSAFNRIFNTFSWRNRINPIMVHDLTTNLSIQFIGKHLDIPIDERINQYVDEQRKHLRPLIKKKTI